MRKRETRIVFVRNGLEPTKGGRRLVSLYRVERLDGHSLFGPAPWRDCVAWRWRTLA